MKCKERFGKFDHTFSHPKFKTMETYKLQESSVSEIKTLISKHTANSLKNIGEQEPGLSGLLDDNTTAILDDLITDTIVTMVEGEPTNYEDAVAHLASALKSKNSKTLSDEAANSIARYLLAEPAKELEQASSITNQEDKDRIAQYIVSSGALRQPVSVRNVDFTGGIAAIAPLATPDQYWK